MPFILLCWFSLKIIPVIAPMALVLDTPWSIFIWCWFHSHSSGLISVQKTCSYVSLSHACWICNSPNLTLVDSGFFGQPFYRLSSRTEPRSLRCHCSNPFWSLRVLRILSFWSSTSGHSTSRAALSAIELALVYREYPQRPVSSDFLNSDGPMSMGPLEDTVAMPSLRGPWWEFISLSPWVWLSGIISSLEISPRSLENRIPFGWVTVHCVQFLRLF